MKPAVTYETLHVTEELQIEHFNLWKSKDLYGYLFGNQQQDEDLSNILWSYNQHQSNCIKHSFSLIERLPNTK